MSGPQSGAPTGTNVTPLGSYLSSKSLKRSVGDVHPPDESWSRPDSIPGDQDTASANLSTTPTDLRFADSEIGPELLPPEVEVEVEVEDPGDWAWVEEWRAGGEPVPWGPGLTIAGFALFLVASAVYVLSTGLSDRPLLAIGVNVVVAGGLGPALWLSRGLPVLRWIAGGAALGVLAAWACVLIFLT